VKFNTIISININPAITTSLSKMMTEEVREREREREMFAYHHLNDEETRCPCVSHIVCSIGERVLRETTKERKTTKENYVHVDKQFDKVCEIFQIPTTTTTTTTTTKSKSASQPASLQNGSKFRIGQKRQKKPHALHMCC
jgi:hypothetical protein